MPVSYFNISPELLIEICKGLTIGNDLRIFKVVADGLPLDAKFVNAEPILSRHPIIRITLESDSFIEGQTLPPVVIKAVEAKGDPYD